MIQTSCGASFLVPQQFQGIQIVDIHLWTKNMKFDMILIRREQFSFHRPIHMNDND